MATETHEEWFFALPIAQYRELCANYIHDHFSLPTDIDDYDEWLNYFKKLPVSEVKQLAEIGESVLTAEAYSALARWVDIVENPSRIDKLHQSGLSKAKGEKTIAELANSNDKLGVLYAIRSEIAEKLDKGTGARDTAALAKEMANIMDLITEAERRQGPSKDTKLAELMGFTPAKRTRSKGARNTSYMSRTIKEVEDA